MAATQEPRNASTEELTLRQEIEDDLNRERTGGYGAPKQALY